MSTGADCMFWEDERGWWYKLQRHPYGETMDYDTFGPFTIFERAENHLSAHHANPGGWTRSPLPGCEHPLMYRKKRFDPKEWECRKCGHIHYPKNKR